MTRSFATLLVVLGAAAATGVTAGQARTPAPVQTDVLGSLLAEVRALRVAMEQMASAGPRIQLALGRLQMQEQRVNTLARRHETVRGEIAAVQREYDMAAARIRSLQRAFQESPDPAARKQAESAIDEHQREYQRTGAELQRLQGEENALSAEISVEQSRWNDVNRRLEELERSLGR